MSRLDKHTCSDHRIVINPSNFDCLSCDNRDDAMESLALAYGINKEAICRVYQVDWPDFLPSDVESEVFQDERLTWCMAQHMRCSDVSDVELYSAHYHRGLFNGDKGWFDRGLLNSEEGAKAFLEYLRPKLPSACDFEHIEALALSNIRQRSSGEFEWGGGPYAFDRLDDAKGAQKGGLDYSVPEFFMGRCWDQDRHAPCNADVLRELCKEHFVPVVVKFTARTSRVHAYVNNLWHYLHRQKFHIALEPNCYTFSGRNRTVPHGRIHSLIVNF